MYGLTTKLERLTFTYNKSNNQRVRKGRSDLDVNVQEH